LSIEPLLAEALRSDPRIAQARQLLQSALQEHRSALTGVRPPRSSRQQQYSEAIATFSEQRGGKLFFPYLGSGIGNGPLVELADGSVKFDMISGIGVHVFGHSDPELMDAGLAAALEDTIMQGNLQQNVESAELCRSMIEIASSTGAPLRHCFLTTSGATANENALKLLFQARAPATRMLAFSNCFSGRTLATSQLTDRPKNRVGMPTVLAVDYVPFFDHKHPAGSEQRTISCLQEHVQRYPGAHAGMILEVIQGEGGYYAAPAEFLSAVCRALRESQIPIFFDEIQTFGRTTRPFAFQHFGLDEFADVVTVGKMTQVCATLFRDELVPQPGLISQTFTGATASIRAAGVILKRLREGTFFGTQGRLMQIHARFAQHFDRLHAECPECISGPWGIGGMVAFTAGDGSPAQAKRVLEELFASGVIAFSAGADPTRIRMLPPFGVISDSQIDAVCAIIETVLKRVVTPSP
jgi:acetylornithine aminotransferase